MIYTTDFPTENVTQAKRLGYRLPRSVLLPPYLSFNPFFTDWMQAVDEIFDKAVEEKIDIIKNIRNMWVSNPDMERKILAGEIITQEDWSIPEQNIVLKQLNMLGLQLGTPTVLFDEVAFTNLCRFLGMYWFEKGTSTFMDFVNFCCGTQFVIKNCWTKDYKEFFTEGSEEIGTPIWEGGEWFPTTHIKFQAINQNIVDVKMLAQLFYEIANYNLVLYSVDGIYNVDISGSPGAGSIAITQIADFSAIYTIRTKGFDVNV